MRANAAIVFWSALLLTTVVSGISCAEDPPKAENPHTFWLETGTREFYKQHIEGKGGTLYEGCHLSDWHERMTKLYESRSPEFYAKQNELMVLHRRALRHEARMENLSAIERYTFEKVDSAHIDDNALVVLNALHIFMPPEFRTWPGGIDRLELAKAKKEIALWEYWIPNDTRRLTQLYMVRLMARYYLIARDPLLAPLRPVVPIPKEEFETHTHRLDYLISLYLYFHTRDSIWTPQHEFLIRILAEMAVTPSDKTADAFKILDALAASRGKLVDKEFTAIERDTDLAFFQLLGDGAKTGTSGDLREPLRLYGTKWRKMGEGLHVIYFYEKALLEYFGAYLSNRLDTPDGFQLRIREVLVDWAEQWGKETDPKQKEWLEGKLNSLLYLAYKSVEEFTAGDLRPDERETEMWLADAKEEFHNFNAFHISLVKVESCRKKLAAEWAKRQAEDEKIRKEYQDKLRQLEDQERKKKESAVPGQ
jgi:hypothetical protein